MWKYTDLKIEIDEETLATMEDSLDQSNSEKVKEFEEFKKKCAEEKEILYSRVLLSTLSIPLNDKTEDPYTITTDAQKEKEARLAQLLGFDPHPNRQLLFSSLLANDVMDSCHPNVLAIYHLFEVWAPWMCIGLTARLEEEPIIPICQGCEQRIELLGSNCGLQAIQGCYFQHQLHQTPSTIVWSLPNYANLPFTRISTQLEPTRDWEEDCIGPQTRNSWLPHWPSQWCSEVQHV